MIQNGVSLNDLKQRCENILNDNPEIQECAIDNCSNPIDWTGVDWSTACPYHRLLWDYWLYTEVNGDQKIIEMGRIPRRNLFIEWMNEIGPSRCDEIVIKMANDPLQWKC